MDEQYQNRAMMVTTVHIPVWLRQEIKLANLTVNGALIRGWNALKSREQVDDLIRTNQELKLELGTYQRGYANLMKRVQTLEESKK